jgi:hypothetical protein
VVDRLVSYRNAPASHARGESRSVDANTTVTDRKHGPILQLEGQTDTLDDTIMTTAMYACVMFLVC